jgi:hypothetical protein
MVRGQVERICVSDFVDDLLERILNRGGLFADESVVGVAGFWCKRAGCGSCGILWLLWLAGRSGPSTGRDGG